MFEEFSPRYESAFRTFFILWVVGWAVFNGFDSLAKYAEFSFSSSSSDAELLEWWFRIIVSILASTLGIVLLFWSSNIPNRIKKLKPITNISLFIGLTIVYYLFPTISDILISISFNTDGASALRLFVFQTAWLFPSIIVLVFHMLYYVNINKYNELLEESKNKPKKSDSIQEDIIAE
jgi:NADH:ubiquinone oxidoreductase subunit 5 (subunit L)/multisubunit Na+/H+ antiporter MnhA subunit